MEARPVDVPDSPRPSEGSLHKSLTPQEEVKSAIYYTPYTIQDTTCKQDTVQFSSYIQDTVVVTISTFQVKFRKAIEACPSDLDYMRECVAANPRYLVSGADSPVILHQVSS